MYESAGLNTDTPNENRSLGVLKHFYEHPCFLVIATARRIYGPVIVRQEVCEEIHDLLRVL